MTELQREFIKQYAASLSGNFSDQIKYIVNAINDNAQNHADLTFTKNTEHTDELLDRARTKRIAYLEEQIKANEESIRTTKEYIKACIKESDFILKEYEKLFQDNP
jgi:thymidylate synthase